MKKAARVKLHGLVMQARQHPSQRTLLLSQALRLAQQALARDANDRDAMRGLGLSWWYLGAHRRGRALLKACRTPLT